MTRRVRVVLSAVTIPMALGVGLYLRFSRPWETPTDHAHRVCDECADRDRNSLKPGDSNDPESQLHLRPGSGPFRCQISITRKSADSTNYRWQPSSLCASTVKRPVWIVLTVKGINFFPLG